METETWDTEFRQVWRDPTALPLSYAIQETTFWMVARKRVPPDGVLERRERQREASWAWDYANKVRRRSQHETRAPRRKNRKALMDSTKAFNVIYSKAVVIIKKRIAESNKQRETSKACCGEVGEKKNGKQCHHTYAALGGRKPAGRPWPARKEHNNIYTA